MTLIHGLGRVD